jgi:hypothetical protein
MTTTLEPPVLDVTSIKPKPVLVPQYTPSGYNAWLFYEVMDYIMANPKGWDQESWGRRTDCGTTFCVAGWTVVLLGHTPKWERYEVAGQSKDEIICNYLTDGRVIEDVAAEALGLDSDDPDHDEIDMVFGDMTANLDGMWDAIEAATKFEVSFAYYQEWRANKAAA